MPAVKNVRYVTKRELPTVEDALYAAEGLTADFEERLQIAAELSGHFIFDRPPLAAEALHGNASHLTAVANDYDYESVFARALEGSIRADDVLVAISTSGNSPSIVRAAQTAKEKGATVVAFTGESGGELRAHADLLLNVPSSDTGRIQESHIVFIHAISERVEHDLFAGA